MSPETSTPAANTGAPAFDDDIIPIITGLPLVDISAEVIVRQLQDKSSAARANYVSHIICRSLQRQSQLLDYAQTKEDGVAFVEWGLTEMMRRIGEVLDLLGETEPADADAAALFHLSLNPAHRRAAQAWTKRDEYLASRHFFDTYVQEHWLALAAFFNLCAMSDICAASAWRAGPVACSDEWFDLPGRVA